MGSIGPVTELLPPPRPPLGLRPDAVLDGGLSTQLERRGARVDGPLWTARLLLDDPGLVAAAHRDFVDAGADVVITASYQVSRRGFVEQGLSTDDADAALRRSVVTARESGAIVAASVGPYGATLHDGSEYRGRYGLAHRDLVDFHRERLDVLVAAGPDLLAVETIPDVDEIAALAEVLADHPGLPAWLSMTLADDRHLADGRELREAVAVAGGVVSALGINCTAPHLVSPALEHLRTLTDLPVVVYPNAGGAWDAQAKEWTGSVAATFDEAAHWRELGAVLVGGCCGVDADAIRTLASSAA